MVTLHHFALTSDSERRMFGGAPLAVDFFFCLSGFVIAHAYQERLRGGMAVRNYLARRVIRLYPMYVLGALLGVAALVALKLHGLTDFTWSGIGEAIVLHLLYIPYFNPYTEHLFANDVAAALFPLNNPAWSLFFELVCANTLYAFTARMSRHAAVVITALAGLGVLVATHRYGAASGWGSGNFAGGFPRVMFAFFAGVVIFQWRGRIRALGEVRPVLLLAALLVMLGAPRTASFEVFWLYSCLVAIPVLVAAATTVELRADSPAFDLAGYSGRLSYPIYCIHYPVLMLAAAWQWRPESFALALALFVAVSAAASHLLMVWVDEPLRARLNARLAKGASPRT